MTFKDNNGTPLVVRSEDYYPFGATSRAWSTQTLAEMKFKYQGKERDTETGYDYFEARTYDPQLGRFLQVDPLYEDPKQIGQNSFSAMGNNPVSLVDPTGKIWENEEDRRTLEKAVNTKIEEHKKKIAEREAQIPDEFTTQDEINENQEKIQDLKEQVGQLEQSLQDIEAIANSDEVFRLSNSSNSDGTADVTKNEKGIILIGGNGVGVQIHEIRHIGQSLSNGGKMSFYQENGVNKLVNPGNGQGEMLRNELDAYKAGFSYSGSYPVGGVKKLNEMKTGDLKYMRDGDGKLMYTSLFSEEKKK